MTYQSNFTLPSEIMEQINEHGLEFLPDLIQTVMNTAMQIERQKYLGVDPYERSCASRSSEWFQAQDGQNPGWRDHPGNTAGASGGFYPEALEKGLRSERALTLTMAEMYVQGVSTRKVNAIVEQLCGIAISSVPSAIGPVGQDAGSLAQPAAGRNRLFVSGRSLRKSASGWASAGCSDPNCPGNCASGHRQVLGVSVSLSEQEVHWRTFLQSLVERGLVGCS